MGQDALTEALGLAVAALPGGGEAREGQVTMAHAVAAAIEDGRHLVVQAGTGTGKSLAYLVPALLSGQKVVVATATKALQDQLAGKDLPFLAEHLPVPITFAVLKGRSNYLCRQRAAEVAGGDDQLSIDTADDDLREGGIGRQVLRLIDWGRTSETGDRSELDFEPSPRAWAGVSVSAMECPGALKCPRGDDCFAEAARKRAEGADVVVVNTHLYGAHLASRGHVLPLHDVVVFDEAHELEDVAATSLGLELGAGRFRALVRTMRPLVKPEDQPAIDDLAAAGERFDTLISAWRGRRLPQPLDDDLQNAVVGAAERVAKALSAVRAGGDDDAGRRARAQQAGGHLGGDLAMIADLPKSHVAWVEGPPHAPSLKVAAIDVAERLAGELWEEVTAVLTSATIPPRLRERVGLPEDRSEEMDVGSPFDYRAQARLYVPRLPDPRSERYEAAVHAELRFLMETAGGRTLALFTSWRAMQAAADALAGAFPWHIYRQDDLPKPALIRAFTDDESSCLFATMGFWQGVDVPGAACSVVAIDRIPFPRPDEPLMQARRERAGVNAFRLIDLPRAATLLAQGAGRLIRSSTDRGVVAVLDKRLAEAGYRREILDLVPPMRRTRDRADVVEFLAPLHAAPSSPPA